jgi:CheY-like chemotaxis protein
MTDIPKTRDRAMRVLIADDDRGIVRFLADRCMKMGFEVQTASNGLQALMMANRSQPDVLITDVNMPEVDGLSVCLRLLSSDRRSVKAIVVMGRSKPETIERCESFGAIHVCKGPHLWERIQSTLTKRFPLLSQGTEQVATAFSWLEIRERPQVLLVDNDPDAATFLSSRLRKYGVEMLYASDAAKGYRIACREQPSVIISELFMPNGDAHYLLRKLRSTAETETISVFVVSGRDVDRTTEAELKRDVFGKPGVAQIFKKSFDTHKLFAALQKVCAFDHLLTEG